MSAPEESESQMTVTADKPTTTEAAPGPNVIQLDVRAVSVVWLRELLRYRSDRLRIISVLVMPVLFLLVLGTGLADLAGKGMPAGVDFRTYIFPGVLAFSVLFTSTFSGGSVVWDREVGFLREMLVAPVHRWAILLGKCLGGATVATIQGLVIFALAWIVHVPYNPVLLLTLVGELLLLSFTMTALGVMMGARITQMLAFFPLSQMAVMPLFFLSGALYPLAGLPTWLAVLTRLDPLTYIVYPMRSAVFSHLGLNRAAIQPISRSVTWNGWPVPIDLSLGIVAITGIALLTVATAEFRKME